MFNSLFPNLNLGPLPGIQQTPTRGLLGPAAPVAPAQMPMNVGTSPNYTPVPFMEQVKRKLSGLPSLLLPDESNGFLDDKEQGQARRQGLMDFGLSLLAGANGTNGGNAPSVGQALLGAVSHARDTYNTATDHAVQSKLSNMQLGMTTHLIQGRQAIGDFIQKNMTGDPTADSDVLRKAFMMANALGDTELAKSLESVVAKSMDAPPAPIQVGAGGDTLLLDPRNPQHVIGDVRHTPGPIDPTVMEERQMRLQMAIQEANARGDMRRAQELQQLATRENTAVDNYRNDPDIKYGTAVAQVAGQLQALRARAMAGDPFAQYQALEGILRLRNPEMNRAPNPADYAVLAQSMGFTGKLRKKLENFKQGTILPADAMRKMYLTADNMVRQGQTRFNAARKNHLSRAQHFGIDAEALPDVFESVHIPPQGSSAFNPLMGILTPQDR